jgi:hypothetical protein
MKVKIYFNLLITLVVILFASCAKSNEIIEDDESLIFSFHRGGSWIGLNENLEISASAIHYSISYRELQTSERKSYETTVKTSNEQWDYLTNTFDLETFTKIKNGSCRSCVDGFDEIFSAIKDGKTYSFTNGDNDEHYQQMQAFFDSILEQVESFEIIAKFR